MKKRKSNEVALAKEGVDYIKGLNALSKMKTKSFKKGVLAGVVLTAAGAGYLWTRKDDIEKKINEVTEKN